jgi:hypothetical protein
MVRRHPGPVHVARRIKKRPHLKNGPPEKISVVDCKAVENWDRRNVPPLILQEKLASAVDFLPARRL